MKLLFAPSVYREVLDRIDQLNPESQPKWGEMNVAQMMDHCAEVQDVSNGKALNGSSFMVKLFKGMIRKIVVSEKPYKPGIPTHPQYRQSEPKDFAVSKARLLKAIRLFAEENKDGPSQHKHPLFGEMSHQEKGWSTYKHIDHHLQQFGV